MITLVIIGVIAAATIPTLINNTQKKEDVARIKKAYSTLQSSIHKIALDRGYPQGDYSFITDVNTFFDDFEKTVNTIKRCNGSSGCIPFDAKSLNGDNNGVGGNTNAIVTSDGIIYTFNNQNYGAENFGIASEDYDKRIGRFFVDINGNKGPQTFGKDLFAFVLIQDKGVLPAGYGNTDNCNKNSYGITCTAKVLRENAINY